MTDTPTERGERIRQARTARGVSQGALAGKLRATPATVSRWENGRQEIRLDRLATVARELRVSFEWLALGQGRGPDAEAAP